VTTVCKRVEQDVDNLASKLPLPAELRNSCHVQLVDELVDSEALWLKGWIQAIASIPFTFSIGRQIDLIFYSSLVRPESATNCYSESCHGLYVRHMKADQTG